MMQRLRIVALPLLAAVVALFVGLEPNLLRTGRVEPLDWLVPGFVALALMILGEARHERRLGWLRLVLYTALTAVPPILVAALSATRVPWLDAGLLGAFLALSGLALDRAIRARAVVRWSALLLGLALCLAVQWLARPFDLAQMRPARPYVGVVTALPLFSQHGAAGGLMDVGGRAPMLKALQLSLRPVDVVDADSLEPHDVLLMAQPRLLRPEELVALDAWVRDGGYAVILADPLLRWSDGYPLGSPRRAPLTSLLDPLLAHWGLMLEPARPDADEPVERRVLSRGAVIQLAGASRFAFGEGASCVAEEGGLIARCRVGKGRAVLMADADWINDPLWTLNPANAEDRRFWTGDAVPLLNNLLTGGMEPLVPIAPWLISQDALISALRWALGLILLLGVPLAAGGPIPISTHDPPMPARGSEADSGGAFPDSG